MTTCSRSYSCSHSYNDIVLASTLALSFATFVMGCATLRPSIVKRPEIQQVRKVALLSITAPQRVPHKTRKSIISGLGESNRAAIADGAFSAYVAEFKKLGWEIIPTSQLSALPIYKENFAPKLSKANNGLAKALNTLSTSDASNTYISPTGLYPIVWKEESHESAPLRFDLANLSIEKEKSLKTRMQEVAAQIGADAAVLIQADYCYEDGNAWVGHAGSGTGTAVITGASAIYAVTPKGTEVIQMKRIAQSCGGENRVASDSTSAMVGGLLVYKNETVQKMFLEVAKKSATENIQEIQKAMQN